MTGGNPPITVADPTWKAGYKLSGYEVAETARAAGFDLKIPVELSLEDPKGKRPQGKGQVHRERRAVADGDPLPVLSIEPSASRNCGGSPIDPTPAWAVVRAGSSAPIDGMTTSAGHDRGDD